MAQPILIGLISALAAIAVGIFSLIGVLITTSVNWRLGKRTGEVAQQSADGARIAQLVEENMKARAEISQVWAANQALRQASELAETRVESERDGWEAKEKTLLTKLELLLSQAEEKNEAVSRAEEAASRAEAERDIALEGHASAEGGLLATRKTITEISDRKNSLPERISPERISL